MVRSFCKREATVNVDYPPVWWSSLCRLSPLSFLPLYYHVLFYTRSPVHWGYFSKTETPVLTVESGDEVIVEMATHHAGDDYDKMIRGDPGMEDIYLWSSENDMINEPFRGATGSGDGVHILTYVKIGEDGQLFC